jgi:hypothetical protein
LARILSPKWALCFCCWSSIGLACKTVQPKEEAVIVVDSLPQASADEGAATNQPEPVPERGPSLLSEALPPVRGGAHVLPAYVGNQPCKMALTGDSPVAKACSQRGLRGALDLMQIFVKRAKGEGFAYACVDCHADEDDYTNLTPQADAEFRKLLFLARPE